MTCPSCGGNRIEHAHSMYLAKKDTRTWACCRKCGKVFLERGKDAEEGR